MLFSSFFVNPFLINYASAKLRPESDLCLGLREGRHDVGHFGKATGRGVFYRCRSVSRYRMDAMVLGLHPLRTPFRFRDIR